MTKQKRYPRRVMTNWARKTYRIPKETDEALGELAVEEKLSINALVVRLLDEAVSRRRHMSHEAR